jgi:hypothetical protein
MADGISVPSRLVEGAQISFKTSGGSEWIEGTVAGVDGS